MSLGGKKSTGRECVGNLCSTAILAGPETWYANALMPGFGTKLRGGMPGSGSRWISLKSILGGVAISSAAAVLLCLILDGGRETRLAAPAVCLLVVILTSIYLGRLAGIFGAVAASCILAIFLYSPVGTLYVEEHAARMMLNLFLIAAIGVAWLVPRRSSHEGERRAAPRKRMAPALKRDQVE